MANKRLARRDFLRLSAGATAGALLASCAPPEVVEVVQTVEVEKVVEVERTVEVEREVAVTAAPARDVLELPNAATGVPYELKSSVNHGDPIEIDYWEWALDRADYEKGWAQEYMSLYPNVTINVVTQGWDDHFTKMAVSAPAGQGPAFFHMHTNELTSFCEGGLMDPMPDWVASQGFLNEHWFGFAEGAFDCPGTPGTGKRYFIPMGAQLPVLLINRRLWEEAGLTDADVPKTWEQMRDVAKALTKYDSAGRIMQAGLQANWSRLYKDALLQQGRYLYNAEATKIQLDNEESYRTMELINNLFNEDKVIDPEFPELVEAFSSELAAIIWEESWIVSTIQRNNPDLDFFVALTPTFTGEMAPSVGHMHFAVEAIVNAYASPDVKDVAWDFWHFLYSNDERLVHDIALRNGMLPSYRKLQSHPAVQANPVASTLVPGMEYGVIVGETPGFYYDTITNLIIQPVLLQGESIQNAIAQGEAEVNAQLAQRELWNVIERNYKHDDLMIPNQP